MKEDNFTSTVDGAAAFERQRAIEAGEDEIAHDRYVEAGEELEVERAIERGEARECGCGLVVGADEPCPDCEGP